MTNLLLFFVLLSLFGVGISCAQKPNIIVIMADDYGWNDASFHGADEIPTPNIDALAYSGVILNSHYSQAICTPSRAALLTGKYPLHTGMQHDVILASAPWGLGLDETLLPQHLKRNGYATHAVGKWHLGFFRSEYTPTFRGFDTHFGFWLGWQNYWNHTVTAVKGSSEGIDMRRNMDVATDVRGQYATQLYTDEAVRLIKNHDQGAGPMFLYLSQIAPHGADVNNSFQAPEDEIEKFVHIADANRRIYAAMVSILDKSVGQVTVALKEAGMLDNSIILFLSDNGGQTIGQQANLASNYPLRGIKKSLFEGGSRTVGAIWSPLIKNPQRVSHDLIHITDWLPTLYSAAGLDLDELGQIDGIDVWRTISEGSPSPRTEMVYNVDPTDKNEAFRSGSYKYVRGTSAAGMWDNWMGSTGKDESYSYDISAIQSSLAGTSLGGDLSDTTIQILRSEATVQCPVGLTPIECNPTNDACLFDLFTDPCEQVNLASQNPDILQSLEEKLASIKETALLTRNVAGDPAADPSNWGGVWSPWKDGTF